ncbi:JmjC domain-containing protein [Cupriavidus sp. UGS-1]|uniref:JmjC domain-containing protein n=1 Tax=Cupriavidus sp. UGS-1 TaxID=2899826 RepID=UPI001E31005A|nr:hypothetical protein [Cupriavidus sp. UGS-1]
MKHIDLAHRLLHDEAFMASCHGGTFLRMQASGPELRQLFSWDDLNDSLSCNRLTNDRLRLSTERDHDIVNRRAFRPVRDRFGRRTDQLVISELHRLMEEGVTAVLEAVNELAPPVEKFTEQMGGTLGVRSSANAYMSFGSTSGFGRHNDDHDVIVIQIDGRKKWTFFQSPNGYRHALVTETSDQEALKAGETITVSRGDILFIPKGTWHDVISIGEPSLHLTVSLVYPTVSDFIAWGMQQDRFGIPFTDIRPDGGSFQALVNDSLQFMTTLISNENLNRFLRFHRSGHANARLKADFPVLNQPTGEAMYRRIPIDAIPLERRAGTVKIYALGRTHLLTDDEYTVLCRLPHFGGMRGDDLASVQADWNAVSQRLRSLMNKGLVGKDIECRPDRVVARDVAS